MVLPRAARRQASRREKLRPPRKNYSPRSTTLSVARPSLISKTRRNASDGRIYRREFSDAQPAVFEFEGKTVRPLGREVDKAFALIASLDEAQRKQAILGFQMRDLALGPGRDGQTIQPEGIKGSALAEKQRELLLDLASEWTGILHEAVAKAKMDEMRKNIAETWFAWTGPT